MSTTQPRLIWNQMAPAPDEMLAEMLAAECGSYRFEISRMPDDAGYVLQVWQIRPEDWPLGVWEMDEFTLEEKAKAERLAGQHVPDIIEPHP